MKSQEQRIYDAARALRGLVHFPNGASESTIARLVLEAADREPPKWPTDETLDAAFGYSLESARNRLRGALFNHDPIIQAAIACRDASNARKADLGLSELIDAVNEAGL